MDVVEVDPVPIPLLHVKLAHGARHKVLSVGILRPDFKRKLQRKTLVLVWMPVEKLLHHFLGCIVLFHQMLSVEIPVFSQLATDAAIHNLLKKLYCESWDVWLGKFFARYCKRPRTLLKQILWHAGKNMTNILRGGLVGVKDQSHFTSSEQVWQSLHSGIFSFSTQANQLIFWNLLGTFNILERRRAMLDILVILLQWWSGGYWGRESASQAFMQLCKGSTRAAATFTFVTFQLKWNWNKQKLFVTL